MPKHCIIAPPKEVYDAARYLDAAASAHLLGDSDLAARLVSAAEIEAIRKWTESMWGQIKKHILHELSSHVVVLPKEERIPNRMPTAEQRSAVKLRDGFHCRYCGIQLIGKEVRHFFHSEYPEMTPWGTTNLTQHAAFQAMWLQYDHVVPHSVGGDNSLDNIVLSCAPCNYGKSGNTIEQLGITNPFERAPIGSGWDGLERVLARPT